LKGIILSGMPAVGKTTAAFSLCKEFDIDYHSGGDLLKELAKKKGYEISGSDWWDDVDGFNFIQNRMKDFVFDRWVDKKLLELLNQGNVVITSYTLPWLISGKYKGKVPFPGLSDAKQGISVWLEASIDNRAKRLCTRDNIDIDKAMKIVKDRDSKNQELYRQLYDIDFGQDLSVFDLTIDTNDIDINEVSKILIKSINESI
jgi:cytidylate kinase